MRVEFSASSVVLAGLLVLNGCADAPITPEHLAPNGELRSSALEQAAFSAAPDRSPQQAIRISAVLAAQGLGALEDASQFSPRVGAVHLHLRADGLLTPRPVIYRWTHGSHVTEVLGILAASDALTLSASHRIGPAQVGSWTVEVLGIPSDGGEPTVLYQRAFEVRRPTS